MYPVYIGMILIAIGFTGFCVSEIVASRRESAMNKVNCSTGSSGRLYTVSVCSCGIRMNNNHIPPLLPPLLPQLSIQSKDTATTTPNHIVTSTEHTQLLQHTEGNTTTTSVLLRKLVTEYIV